MRFQEDRDFWHWRKFHQILMKFNRIPWPDLIFDQIRRSSTKKRRNCITFLSKIVELCLLMAFSGSPKPSRASPGTPLGRSRGAADTSRDAPGTSLERPEWIEDDFEAIWGAPSGTRDHFLVWHQFSCPLLFGFRSIFHPRRPKFDRMGGTFVQVHPFDWSKSLVKFLDQNWCSNLWPLFSIVYLYVPSLFSITNKNSWSNLWPWFPILFLFGPSSFSITANGYWRVLTSIIIL